MGERPGICRQSCHRDGGGHVGVGAEHEFVGGGTVVGPFEDDGCRSLSAVGRVCQHDRGILFRPDEAQGDSFGADAPHLRSDLFVSFGREDAPIDGLLFSCSQPYLRQHGVEGIDGGVFERFQVARVDRNGVGQLLRQGEQHATLCNLGRFRPRELHGQCLIIEVHRGVVGRRQQCNHGGLRLRPGQVDDPDLCLHRLRIRRSHAPIDLALFTVSDSERCGRGVEIRRREVEGIAFHGEGLRVG